MFTLPALPGWDGLHPLIVHFPVALLLVVPFFILIGLLFQKAARGFLLAALVLLALGTMGTFLAVPTGEAAARLAERTDEMAPVLTQHQSLAEKTRLAFTALTLLLATGMAFAKFRRPGRIPPTVLLLGFLVVWAGATLLLVNTAHTGGLLVHQCGVHALVSN
jgi:uncharacterized membrane protein